MPAKKQNKKAKILSTREHCILRPDMYIGSIENVQEKKLIFSEGKIIEKEMEYNQGFERLFIELMSNAIDNKWESEKLDIKMTKITIEVDQEQGKITVSNDGRWISVEKQIFEIEDERNPEKSTSIEVYPPQVYFSYARAGTNYDDEEKRKTSGRNGIGAKAVNYLSSEFEITCIDPQNKKKFNQVFRKNATISEKPKITSCSNKNGFTQISYIPDFEKFGIDGISDEFVELFHKNAIDCAMVSGLNVYFNGEKINVKNLLQYAKLYILPEQKLMQFSSKDTDVVLVEQSDKIARKKGFQHVAFANGIYNKNGGAHVKAWIDAILTPVRNSLNSKNKDKKSKITLEQIKKYTMIFVRTEIDNPVFESQSKHQLISPKPTVTKPTDAEIKRLLKWDIKSHIQDEISFAEEKKISKSEKGKKMILGKKAREANWATKKGSNCTLIIAEGLSAKTFVESGLSFIENGTDLYGTLALKGKLISASKNKSVKLNENKEIQLMKQMIGLQRGVDYSDDKNFEKLRYKSVEILTDADSVAENTPVLVKKEGIIFVIEIKDLTDEFILTSTGKEYNTKDINFQVWTEKGWTKIAKVMRHKVTKDMYQVKTLNSSIEVTEDHSLLDKKGDEISPKDCKFGDYLLQSFPDKKEFNNGIKTILSETLDEDLAYVMGLLWASKHRPFDEWTIKTQNISEVMSCFGKIYKHINWNISYNSSVFTCVLRDKDIADHYTKIFYPNGVKVVPWEILNSSASIKQEFCRGWTDSKDPEKTGMYHTITAQTLYVLFRSIGNKLCFFDSKFCTFNSGQILSVEKLPKKEQYVYDLETENHHFQAGVGELIVHNTDGFHIEGLIIDYFWIEFPELLQRGFVKSMRTPAVRLTLPSTKEKLTFYSHNQFKKWQEENPQIKFKARYYKGLGTNTYADAKEAFEDDKKVEIVMEGTEDEEHEMNVGFNPKYANERKKMLTEFDPRAVYYEEDEEGNLTEIETEIIEGEQTLTHFINNKLVLYHIESTTRALPDIIDGMKEGQRKILFTSLKTKLFKDSIKVVQLGGRVLENACYHHGESSLFDTITKMAQGFVGARNIPLFVNDGQFGSRIDMGEDHAAPRYVLTKLEEIVKSIFVEEDNKLLECVIDEGIKVEPCNYCPIVPMVLINGVAGIGTGFSTDIPSFNPEDLIEWIETWISNKEGEEQYEYPKLVPWWRGYNGEIKMKDENTYETKGVVNVDSKGFYHVTELPIKMATSTFKEILEKMSQDKQIQNFDEYNTANTVNFIVKPSKNNFDPELLKSKLVSTGKLTNMVFMVNGAPKKFDTLVEILEYFCEYRYDMYQTRKDHMLKNLNRELKISKNKLKFIKEIIIDKTLEIYNREEKDLYNDLVKKKYDKIIDDEKDTEKDTLKPYRYLVNMSMRSMTKQKLKELEESIKELTEKIKDLEGKTQGDLWTEDLEKFKIAYQKFLTTREDDGVFGKKKGKKVSKKK